MSEKINNSSTKPYAIIGIVSSLTISFLVWLIYFKTPVTSSADWVSHLPSLNALLNSITFVFLVSGYFFIKTGRKSAHIKCMLMATFTSGLFVTSYILYHYFQGDTKFLGQGLIRTTYFFILITHIILSVPLVPLVLTTLWHGLKGNNTKHKKFARITFPIWIYISITGVLIYLILNNFNTI
jgi:putative membrane protein